MSTKLTKKQIKELFLYSVNDTRNWTFSNDNDMRYNFSENRFEKKINISMS